VLGVSPFPFPIRLPVPVPLPPIVEIVDVMSLSGELCLTERECTACGRGAKAQKRSDVKQDAQCDAATWPRDHTASSRVERASSASGGGPDPRSASAQPRFGMLRMPDGTNYAGELLGSLPEGVGVGESKEGHLYAGHWRGGCREGAGCCVLATGGMYWGQFRGNKMDGSGVYVWADGSSYRGQFAADVWHGSALYVTKTGAKWFVRYYRGKRVSSTAFHGNGEQADISKAAEEARVSPGGTRGNAPSSWAFLALIRASLYSGAWHREQGGRRECRRSRGGE
jgi:hypothetical protein